MNPGRLIGIVLLVTGAATLVIGGGWLFTNPDLSTSAALLGAGLLLVPVALQLGFGVFMLNAGGREAADQQRANDQRRALNLIESKGQIQVNQAAIELGLSVDDLKAIIHELVGLQVFSGYVNWDEMMLYASQAKDLREMTNCRVCGGDIALAGKGVAQCQYCGTEYYLS